MKLKIVNKVLYARVRLFKDRTFKSFITQYISFISDQRLELFDQIVYPGLIISSKNDKILAINMQNNNVYIINYEIVSLGDEFCDINIDLL